MSIEDTLEKPTARLIAAAPDLLSALKNLAASFDPGTQFSELAAPRCPGGHLVNTPHRAALQNLCEMAQRRIDELEPAHATIRAMYMAAPDGTQADALLTAMVTMGSVLDAARAALAIDQREMARLEAPA